MLRKIGKSTAKIEKLPTEKDKQSISLEQDRSIRSSRPKATVAPTYHTPIPVPRRTGPHLSASASYRPATEINAKCTTV